MTEQQDLNLEALLKLKRYEMPTEAFWTTFGSNLRTKLDLVPVQKKNFWFTQFTHALCRFSPLTAACTVMLVLALHFSSDIRKERYDVVAQPVSSNECRSSILRATSDILTKSVIQKKIVATTATNCFSF